MKRFMIFGALLLGLVLSAMPADAQVYYYRPGPARRVVRYGTVPYGYYYYGPRYYYGPGYAYGPRYYGGYWSPWGGWYW
jgi:hypothetical protein